MLIRKKLILCWLSIGLLLFNANIYADWSYSTVHTDASGPYAALDTCFMAVTSSISGETMGPTPVLSVPGQGQPFMSGIMVNNRCIAISYEAYNDSKWHGSSAATSNKLGLYDNYENQIRPPSQLADVSNLTCVACRGVLCIAATNTQLCLTAPIPQDKSNPVWSLANRQDCVNFIQSFGVGGGMSVTSPKGSWTDMCLPSGNAVPPPAPAAPTCTSSQCTSATPKTPICDNGNCRACVTDGECSALGAGLVCQADGSCGPGCTSNSSCANPTPTCRSGHCKVCSSDGDCVGATGGPFCNGGSCTQQCSNDAQCGAGKKCVNGACQAKVLTLCN